MMLQTVLSRTVSKSLNLLLELHFILNYPPELLPPPNPAHAEEPYNTLVKAFSSFANLDFDDLQPLIPYLERLHLPEGHVLWRQRDEPDGLYVIEAGILRASYCFSEEAPVVEESMVPGTIAGELSALSGLPRNATTVVEKQCVLWKLSLESMRRLEDENPVLARNFTQLVLKGSPLLHVQDLSISLIAVCASCQDGLRHSAFGAGYPTINQIWERENSGRVIRAISGIFLGCTYLRYIYQDVEIPHTFTYYFHLIYGSNGRNTLLEWHVIVKANNMGKASRYKRTHHSKLLPLHLVEHLLESNGPPTARFPLLLIRVLPFTSNGLLKLGRRTLRER
jgi:hypothetical protein